jgi:biopolymer transport protein TolQ|tara:strand:- start:403 stop:1131 length:729 start_codon:yes stop_codon:yes gene_type:complete
MGRPSWSLVLVTLLAAPVTFSWWEMLTSSGPLGIAVLLILVAMSVGCWGIIIAKFLQLRRAENQNKIFLQTFWNSNDLESVYRVSTEMDSSPVAQIFKAGYAELHRNRGGESTDSFIGQMGGFENIERALHRGAVAQVTELEKLNPFLATTGATAPFIGLFGTVIGIIRAFHQIGLSGSANLATVAPGISEALVVTAAGLAAAIPAVIAYNYFLALIRRQKAEMESFSNDLLNIIKRHFFQA